MKVLVCGAAGFIGSHVVDALRRRGETVLGLDSLDPGVHRRLPDYLREDVDYCIADLRRWTPDDRFRDLDAVVHLAALGGVSRAAREPAEIIAGNAGGTARLFEAARSWRLRRFVLISSFSIYGSGYRYRCPACGHEQGAGRRTEALQRGCYEVACEGCGRDCQVLPIGEEARPDPLETYGASKYMQELALRGLDPAVLAILRLSSVYGPRLRLDDGEATIIAKLAGWIQAGVTPTLFEDGEQLRDWIYVGDVVDAVLALLDGNGGAVTNVCTGQGTSLRRACRILAEILNKPCTPTIVGGFRPGDMRHCLGDPARLTALLGRPPLPFAAGARLAFSPAAGLAHS
jgi:dTDP-L-rhamnose 4-epimerase